MDNSKIIIVTLLSAAVTMAVLPVVRKFSIKIGNVDKPRKDARKLHSIEVPNGAGIAIYFGFLVAVLSIGAKPCSGDLCFLSGKYHIGYIGNLFY